VPAEPVSIQRWTGANASKRLRLSARTGKRLMTLEYAKLVPNILGLRRNGRHAAQIHAATGSSSDGTADAKAALTTQG